MKTMYVYDRLNGDIKEVAVINYIEEYVLLWTNTSRARATTSRSFEQIKELDDERNDFINDDYED